MSDARVLSIDIETAPMVVEKWSRYGDDYISESQVREHSRVICFASKWIGEDPEFFSEYHDGRKKTIRKAYQLLDEADVLITYNGKRFDVPHLNREFAELELAPYSPFAHIDLFQVAKTVMRFDSNKLEHVSLKLGLEGKLAHEGHKLWAACLRPNVPKAEREAAWQTMRAYNLQDTRENEDLYFRLLPWIKTHPNMALFTEQAGCPKCGSGKVQRRGETFVGKSWYQRYRCSDCSSWSRGAKAISRVDLQGVS